MIQKSTGAAWSLLSNINDSRSHKGEPFGSHKCHFLEGSWKKIEGCRVEQTHDITIKPINKKLAVFQHSARVPGSLRELVTGLETQKIWEGTWKMSYGDSLKKLEACDKLKCKWK